MFLNTDRLCEGLKKKNVRGKKSESLEVALLEWDMLSILGNPNLHFMNEATGIGTFVCVHRARVTADACF